MYRDHHALTALAAVFSRTPRTPEDSPVVLDQPVDAADARN